MTAAWESWKPDVYGYVDNEHGERARRHPKCRCSVPCQMRFQCTCPNHRGPKATPWCNGGDGDWCDTCFAKRTETAIAEEKKR